MKRTCTIDRSKPQVLPFHCCLQLPPFNLKELVRYIARVHDDELFRT